MTIACQIADRMQQGIVIEAQNRQLVIMSLICMPVMKETSLGTLKTSPKFFPQKEQELLDDKPDFVDLPRSMQGIQRVFWWVGGTVTLTV